jgi:hypothetical protein
MSDVNTYVSQPGMPQASAPVQSTAAPGAQGAGAGIPVAKGVLLEVAIAAGVLVALGYVFRKGEAKLPPLRIDAAAALATYTEWFILNATVKVLATKYHGHKLAQAYLLVA